ncbi:MAG: hypothetical protein ACR2MP_00860 [Streptosporangiaceae bacterium]
MIANAGLLATSPWIADVVGRLSIEHYAGAGRTTPPTGAKFSPFWTLGHGGRPGVRAELRERHPRPDDQEVRR